MPLRRTQSAASLIALLRCRLLPSLWRLRRLLLCCSSGARHHSLRKLPLSNASTTLHDPQSFIEDVCGGSADDAPALQVAGMPSEDVDENAELEGEKEHWRCYGAQLLKQQRRK
jgi:hypothetical protein